MLKPDARACSAIASSIAAGNNPATRALVRILVRMTSPRTGELGTTGAARGNTAADEPDARGRIDVPGRLAVAAADRTIVLGQGRSGFQVAGCRRPGASGADSGGTGGGAHVIVDDGQTLAAVAGEIGLRSDAALRPLAAAPATATDRLVAALWRAGAMSGSAQRVAAGAGGPLEASAWGEILVAADAALSPYAALREVTGDGLALPGPVACLTLGGASLRGQHGRRWQAVRGNLHLSVAVPCDLEAAACAPSLPMLAAVALCEAAEDLLGAAPARDAGLGIKWVNDVVLAGGKAGGVLTSLRTRGSRVETYFAGLALNLAQAPVLGADPFALPATALASSGADVPLGRAAAAVLARLRRRLDEVATAGVDGLVEAYCSRSLVLGREVEVWPDGSREAQAAAPLAPVPPPRWRGTVVAILPDLSLRLSGHDRLVTAGCLRLAGVSGIGGPAG
jgi:BirA family biotin operon repressor/biotin-[acetyl-CoA-carboxylase] ligase